ncbi:type II secretion system minor pseudopilin GspI [Vibrio sp. ZSDE26]|uniref:Type II secretion system protein I n=1 Tax=Vibrio amylolyticus TaxID=2847292 RepID=A0A9X2BHS4_9VIBR|nr:type II secretion system minor pseudopilin GspI [Vibrio amylolyticus]MCK6263315.1 type II secretion system minor pseudopilin GspI [Vibrio amylolyticus]
MMNRFKPSRGMTLLEVLVALAIFATAAISVIRSVGQHINTITHLEDKTFAAMVVDNQMANVLLNPSELKGQQGTEELAERKWYWKVTPIKTSDGLLSAFDVSASLSEQGDAIVTVRSYVAK